MLSFPITTKVMATFRNVIAKGWGADTTSDEKEHVIKSTGQCAVTAIMLQQCFGGIMVSTKSEGGLHWYNRVKGYDVDITGDQYGHDPVRIVPEGTLYDDAQPMTEDDVDGATILRSALLALKASEIALREMRERTAK